MSGEVRRMDYFEAVFSVSSFDCDSEKRLRLSSLFRFLQETAERHLTQFSLSHTALQQKGMALLTTQTEANLLCMPVFKDELRFVTRPVGSAGAQLLRQYQVYRRAPDEGEFTLCAEIFQASVAVEFATHKILRPKAFGALGFDVAAAFQTQRKPVRLRFPALQPVGQRQVRRSDIDYNGHLNNTVYLDILYDFMPQAVYERGFSAVQIAYEGECMENETLQLYGGQEDGRFYLRGENPRGVSFLCTCAP